MKRNFSIGIALILLSFFVIPNTLAANNDGLFWRVQEGDRFYYTMDSTEPGWELSNEIIFMEVDADPDPLPFDVMVWDDIPIVYPTFYFENETNMGVLALIFLYLEDFALPVGNWDFLTTKASSGLSHLNEFALDSVSPDFWGYSWVHNGSTDTLSEIHVSYSKFDGAFNEYSINVVNATTMETEYTWTVSRISLQNLEWGIEEGDRFYFLVEISGYVEFSEIVYLEIDEEGLPAIGYPVADIENFPPISLDGYFQNGTDLGSYEIYFIYAMNIVFPIGNWTLIQDLLESEITMAPTIDSEDIYFFGYSWETTNFDLEYSVHTDYLKMDGFLAYNTVVVTNSTSSEVYATITIERLNLEPYTDRTAPTISSPDDIEMTEGLMGITINWTGSDENPTLYEIYVDGILEDSGSWTSGAAITESLDGLAVGTYNYTIVLIDIAANTVTDQVIVTVQAGGLPSFITDNLLYIAIGVGAILIVGAVVCMRRR